MNEHTIELKDVIKSLRKSMKMTQEQFAAAYGVVPMTVSRWERGKQIPRKDELNRMGLFDNVPAIEFSLKNEAPQSTTINNSEKVQETTSTVAANINVNLPESNVQFISDVVMVPIISDHNITACCGNGTAYATDVEWEIEDHYPIPASDLMGYAWQGCEFKLMKASGVSMEPYIHEGDLVLFAQFCEVNDGDIIVVALDGRVFVKGIVKMTKASILLRSYNWQVAPDLDIPLDGSSEIAILGKVIDVISKRKLPRII